MTTATITNITATTTGTGIAETADDVTAFGPATFNPTGAAGTVWGALRTVPDGATVTAIADASGVSRSAVTKALAAFADAGHAVRTPGAKTGRGRTPDIWAPVTGDNGETATTGAVTDAEADTDAETGPDGEDDTDGATEPRPDDESKAAPVASGASSEDALRAAMRILHEEADRRAAAEDALRRACEEEAERRARIDAELAKAHARESTRTLLAELLGVVTTTLAAVTDDDEEKVAAGLEQVAAYASAVRRASRPSATGRVPGQSARPAAGGTRNAPRPLRPAVAEHLHAHPGKEFTPGEIARVLDRSPGAVANALDTLVGHGIAELTCERPRRFRAASSGPDTGGGTDENQPANESGDSGTADAESA
ncbi:hypothetical protein GCM10010191_12710 [Actinomadura vinacea]|uniref:MarR family transcriptional regulator n=1 Tax=Actinomadura vinacea TaxID=115336 RepID=A0ABN3IL24_9ACTN